MLSSNNRNKVLAATLYIHIYVFVYCKKLDKEKNMAKNLPSQNNHITCTFLPLYVTIHLTAVQNIKSRNYSIH